MKETENNITPPGNTSQNLRTTTLAKAGQDLINKDTAPQQSEQSQSGDSHRLCWQSLDYQTNERWQGKFKVNLRSPVNQSGQADEKADHSPS